MKIEFNTHEPMAGLLRDMVHALVVSCLKESVEDCKSFNKHPGDRAYNKKYKAAAKIIIKHYGG